MGIVGGVEEAFADLALGGLAKGLIGGGGLSESGVVRRALFFGAAVGGELFLVHQDARVIGMETFHGSEACLETETERSRQADDFHGVFIPIAEAEFVKGLSLIGGEFGEFAAVVNEFVKVGSGLAIIFGNFFERGGELFSSASAIGCGAFGFGGSVGSVGGELGSLKLGCGSVECC